MRFYPEEIGIKIYLTRKAITTKRAWKALGMAIDRALRDAYDAPTRESLLASTDHPLDCPCSYQVHYEWARTVEPYSTLVVWADGCPRRLPQIAYTGDWLAAWPKIADMLIAGRPHGQYSHDLRSYEWYDDFGEQQLTVDALPQIDATRLIQGERLPLAATI